MANLSERSVQRAINELVEMGEVKRIFNGGGPESVRGDRRPNLFELTLQKESSRGDNQGANEDSHGVTNEDHGVTTRVSRGDKQGFHGVTTLSPKPKPVKQPVLIQPVLNQPLAAMPQKRTNPLFDAVLEELQIAPNEMTKTGGRSIAVAVAELRKVGATAAAVRERCENYRQRFPHAALTAPALAKHWASLARGQPQNGESGMSQNRRNIIAAARKDGVIE